MPPAILDLRFASPGRGPHHVWLPLFLLWPLVLALLVLVLVFTVIADVVLLITGQRYHHITILVVRSFMALNEVRGMELEFKDGDTAFAMTIR
jgi:hypothetical protein